MQQKQYDKAEASLVKEVTKNERNAEAWFLLGPVSYTHLTLPTSDLV